MNFLRSKSKSIYNALDRICRKIQGVSLYEISKHTEMPDNPFVETSDLPSLYKWCSFFTYYIVFLGLFVYFLYSNYEQGITQSFISLDPTAGVCKSIPGSKKCCEVPVSLTGEFIADTNGKWSTQPNFTYTHGLYGLTASGLQYTNEQYASVMDNISKQLKPIGTKAAQRDYAWNLVSLSSFIASNSDFGNFQFYSTGDAAIIYNQAIYGANMGSASSTCNFDWTSSYSDSSSQLIVNFDLNYSYAPGLYTCPYDGVCENSCPGSIALEAFGYDSSKGSSTFQIQVEMSAVTTAIAINIGLNNVSDLIEVLYDNDRIDLFNRMNISSLGIPSLLNTSNYYFSSYYDVLYAPTDPIYCITYRDINISQCLIRFGNTLVYPITSSWGYYTSGATVPKQCTKKASKSGSSKYYCNLMDVIIGFIYYPNTNCDTILQYRRRSLYEDLSIEQFENEILRDSYNLFDFLSGNVTSVPTDNPTTSPSTLPTISPNSVNPSQSSFPTVLSSSHPTSTPTARPSILSSTNVPTSTPTAHPITSTPTAYPSVISSSTTSTPTAYPSVISSLDTSTPSSYYGGYNVYYTEYTYSYGSYAASYGYSTNITTDDFIPEGTCYDNGLIFDFTRAIALVYYNHTTIGNSTTNNTTPNGDTYLTNLAYSALVNTILGSYGSTLSNAFNKLCSGTNIILGQVIPGDCALLSIEFYGGDDRHISKYYYQPSSIAFTNSIYNPPVLKKLSINPPTALIQAYYSCVLAPIPSFLTATGLAFSNATLYLTIFFVSMIYLMLKYLKYYYKIEIPSKLKKVLTEEEENKRTQELLNYLETLKESNILTRMDALTADIINTEYNQNNFSNFTRIVKVNQLKQRSLEDNNLNKKFNNFEIETEFENDNPLMNKVTVIPNEVIEKKAKSDEFTL